MDSRAEILKSCLAEFREMPEACILINYRSRDNCLTFDERMSITRSIEKAFTPVFLEMRAESPSLSESDLIYCALAAAGFKTVVVADCISISKDSLRPKKKRIKEKLTPYWSELLFPESESVSKTVSKTVSEKCYDNDTQHISPANEAAILLQQNQLNSKVMETKKVTFSSAVKSGWKNCFNYSGRASRAEFWNLFTFNLVLVFIIAQIPRLTTLFITSISDNLIYFRIAFVCMYLIATGLLLPVLSVTIRRLHDSEKTAWLSLLVFIPAFVIFISPILIIAGVSMNTTNSLMGTLLTPGLAIILTMCSQKGTEGPNNYGPDPMIVSRPAQETL